MQKYRILGKKGEGTFSEVLKVQDIRDGQYFACKKMKQRYESIDQVNNLREIQAMRRLNPHANVVELKEVIFDKRSGTLALVCELMDMNFYELIRGRKHFLAEEKVKRFMYQVCKSIDHMHRNGIFHRDVKPENILLKDDVVKLADFGSCRSVYSKQPYTEYISTRWYRAPECLLTDGYYGYKMDIWSVGCVFFEIMGLHPLFPGSNEVDQIAKIHDVLGTPPPSILQKLRNKSRSMNFNFPQKKGTGISKRLPHASLECIELIELMCTYDPDERISAKQALRHPYFRQLRDADKKAAVLAKREALKDTTKANVEAPINTSTNMIIKPQRERKKHHHHHVKRKSHFQRLDDKNTQNYLPANVGGTTSLIHPGVGLTLKPTTFSSTTLPKINVATTQTTNSFPTKFAPSIIKQEKDKVKEQASQKLAHYQLPAIDKRGGHGF